MDVPVTIDSTPVCVLSKSVVNLMTHSIGSSTPVFTTPVIDVVTHL